MSFQGDNGVSSKSKLDNKLSKVEHNSTGTASNIFRGLLLNMMITDSSKQTRSKNSLSPTLSLDPTVAVVLVRIPVAFPALSLLRSNSARDAVIDAVRLLTLMFFVVLTNSDKE